MRNQTQPAVGLYLGHGQHRLHKILKSIVIMTLAAVLVVPFLPPRTVAAAPNQSAESSPTTPTNTPSAQALPLPVPPAGSDEAQLFALVNQARLDAGLEPLSWDPELSKVGEAHAWDMIHNGYFGHISPTDGTPAHRAHGGGVEFSRLGENLAGDSDVADAHRLLMASPTHRANILDPGFTHVGIAVVHAGPYGYMIVEMFTVPAAPAIANAADAVGNDAAAADGDAR